MIMCVITHQSVSQSVSYFTVPPRAHPSSRNYLLSRGGDVSARAHTCVAWGRCVAFGRPKMSVWGHTGAGSAPAKVACNTQFAQPNLELICFFFCWNILDFFCFRRKEHHSHLCSLDRHSMETLNCAPEGASARSRSPSRSPEVAPQHPSTPPIRVTESEELVITPDMVSHVDSSCSGCLAPSRRLKHTCTKAKHTGKRHASPAVEARHAKRSGTAGVYALMACEGFHQGEGSASAIGSLTDVRYLRPVERHVPGPHVPSASYHPSSSQEPPPPTRPPSPRYFRPYFRFHGPAPRSPLHRLAVRLRHSRSNTRKAPSQHSFLCMGQLN